MAVNLDVAVGPKSVNERRGPGVDSRDLRLCEDGNIAVAKAL